MIPPVSLLVFACGLAGSTVVGQVATQPTSRPAARVLRMTPIAEEDLALLAKEIRRACFDKVLGKAESPPRYRPPVLRGRRAILHVILRSGGAAVVEAETKEVDLVDGANAAGALLGRALLEKKGPAEKLRTREALADLGLEMEWVGPRDYVDAKFDESQKWSDGLLHCFEPAAEGIGVEFRDRIGFTRPGQIVALNYGADLALQGAESAVKLTQMDKLNHATDIRYFRFPTCHVWQERDAATPVVLVRGGRLITPGDVNSKSLDEAIARIGNYLCYRQNGDGWFSEEYLPSADRYTDSNSAPLQMQALNGLAAYGRWSGRKDILEAAGKGITRSAGFLKPIRVPTASAPASGPATTAPAATTQAGELLIFPGHQSYLTVSARFLSAMCEVGAPFAARQRFLCEALLAAQDEDGALVVQFGDDNPDADNPAAAGWGLIALVQAVKDMAPGSTTRVTVERALGRAQRHYQRWYEKEGDVMGSAVLARAFALSYGLTNDALAADFSFAVMDRLARLQLTELQCLWPELNGAIDASGAGVVGADSSYYLATLAEGVALAERIGDKARMERYRRAVLAGVRFLLQLEVREDGCFYIRSRRDALGGIRRALWHNGLRANNCAETLAALMCARTVLYGPATTSRPAG